MNHTISRREWIRRTGVGLGGALLASSLPRSVHAQDPPKRLLLWVTPNATLAPSWGTDGDPFVFREILAPLEPIRSLVTVIEGLHLAGAEADNSVYGGTYGFALPNVLTASRTTRATSPFLASGPSIDQVIAAANPTAVRSIELVAGTPNDFTGYANYVGANQPIVPMWDPGMAFDRIFGGLTPDPAIERRRRAARNALDFARTDTQRARARMRAPAGPPLDRHAEALRELELRFRDPESCTVPTRPIIAEPRANDSFPDVVQAHRELAIAAFACDATRVATVQLGQPAPRIAHRWLGSTTDFHQLQHESNNAAVRAEVMGIYRWYTSLFVDLVQRLQSVAEGSGTLWDNTLVVWCNTMGDALQHTFRDVPFVLSGGLAPQGGRTLRFARGTMAHNALWVSVARLFGVNLDSFGDASFGTGPLPGFV